MKFTFGIGFIVPNTGLWFTWLEVRVVLIQKDLQALHASPAPSTPNLPVGNRIGKRAFSVSALRDIYPFTTVRLVVCFTLTEQRERPGKE